MARSSNLRTLAEAGVALSVNSAWNVANFRLPLIRALIAQGWPVTVIAPDDGYRAQIEAAGARFEPIAIDRSGLSPRRDAATYRAYHRILRQTRPAAFLGYTVKPNIYGSLAAQRLGIPVVNNIAGLGTAFIGRSVVTRIVTTLYRLALPRSQVVFFQNPDDMALFGQLGIVRPDQARRIAGSGIDPARFAPVPLPTAGQPTIFLLIARLLWDKGVGEFVEAARSMRAAGVAARFQLLGGIGDENRTAIPAATVAQWVAEGTVEHLGRTDDVRPYIAAADCVVLPSYREGLPRVLLEAGAMARPLIASDVPGCREVVADGTNGYLCDVRNAQSLAAAMTRYAVLARPEREAMAAAARTKVATEFDEQSVIAAYLTAIGDAATGAPR